MDLATPDRTVDPAYLDLLRVGGFASIAVAFLTVIEIAFFTLYPQPSTVIEWFELFQDSPVIGLLDFWGLEVLMYVMFALVFLALYVVLRDVNKSGMAIAIVLALLGIAIFFATTNPFSMLDLSRQFADSTAEAERSVLLAAGEALLANTNQRAIGGFNMGLFLVSIAGLITSSVMRRASSFWRLTANIGVLAFGLSLADYLRQAFTSSIALALLFILPGAVFIVVWFSLVGRRLLQLGRKVG